jgi:RNA recognition motif-containing protein
MNIYVGNLSYQATEDDLQSAFSPHGEVTSVAIIRDKFSNQSKGFGFVEMANDEDAKAAIEALNGMELKGRQLRVNEARPREERSGGGGRRGGFGGGGGGRGGRHRDEGEGQRW